MGELLTNVELETGLARAAHQALLDDLRRGHHARLVAAKAMQARFAKALQEAEVSHVEGLGKQTMCIHPMIYWEMIRRYGVDCWSDAAFRRRMMQDEPSLRVDARARKTTVRVNFQLPTSNIQHPRKGTQATGGIVLP